MASYITKGTGTLGVERAQKHERDAVARLVEEEVRARETAAGREDLDAETGASPYREAEAIARDLHRSR